MDPRAAPPSALDDLLALADEIDPDPVDLFEDALARRLGLVRHPGCDLDAWRRMRAEFIDRAEDSGLLDDPSGSDRPFTA